MKRSLHMNWLLRVFRVPRCCTVALVICFVQSQPTAGLDDTKSQIPSNGSEHWSYQAPTSHPVPAVTNHDWPLQPIDYFVLNRLESENLPPNPVADRRTLIRRASFALIGLPPTPEHVAYFLSDSRPDAYSRAIDQLLASPSYGQHWARMWLDIARYAEDQAHIVGNNKSLFYPNAYLYRDWIIRALNRDMPYDEFIRHQLAADVLVPNEPQHLPALGFLGLGPKYYGRGNPEVKADEWEDRVDTVARGLLGLTVACARCHDHKFDPISTEDYYALAGVFASTEMFNRPLKDSGEKNKKDKSKLPDDSMHIVREASPRDLKVFIRGDINNQGNTVKRRFLTILNPKSPFTTGSGRADLAEAIADPNNPLTARVIVNRIWQRLFGQGIVSTTSNFGLLGGRPSHPALLDDLAVRFMDAGWSLKRLTREIVLSATFQQASTERDDHMTADPANILLARMPRRRLEVEAWRDSILTVTGQLDPSLEGRSFDPSHVAESRRTVYSQVSRLDLNQMLALFDFPDPNAHADKRAITTTPLQKLFVLNSQFMTHHATRLCQLMNNQLISGRPFESVIQNTYARLYGRTATSEEAGLASSFVHVNGKTDMDRLEQYAHILLASNEMMFID